VAEPSDEALMLALRAGELPAFDALFRRHYETVRALCARVAFSPSAGDDLAQESFLRVLRHRGTFRGEARFTTWIHRIARNVCLEHIARQTREQRLAERWSVDAAAAAEPDGNEDTEQLAAAMESLTAEQREVLVLCRYHDLPFSEIGAILGCTAGAARERAHRALAALRDVNHALRIKDEGGERMRRIYRIDSTFFASATIGAARA
jgi:RNA polymerase sigma factor (sigma-70 family)